MYKVDVTSTDDEKGEKVRNNLESNITSKVAEKLDADGQSGMHESTKKERRELLEDKVSACFAILLIKEQNSDKRHQKNLSCR